MFSIEPEVLQNCARFTLCCSVGPAVSECSAVMGLTPCMLCVNTGLSPYIEDKPNSNTYGRLFQQKLCFEEKIVAFWTVFWGHG